MGIMSTTSRKSWKSFLLFLLVFNDFRIAYNQITYVERLFSDKFGPIEPSKECKDTYYGSYSDGKNGCQCLSGKSFLYFKTSCLEKSHIDSRYLEESTECNGKIITKLGKAYSGYDVINLSKSGDASFIKHIILSIENVNGKRCKISAVHYIDDANAGKLIQYNATGTVNMFTINLKAKKLSWNKHSNTIVQGRIMRLKTTNCKFNNNIRNPCIAFKTRGNLTFPLPSTSLPASTTINQGSSDVVSTTSEYLTSSKIVETTQFLSSTPPAASSKGTMMTTAALNPTKTLSPASSSIFVVPVKTSKPPNNKRREDEESGSVDLIAGLSVGIIIIVLAIILIIVCRRRAAGLSRSTLTQNVKKKPTNPTYDKDVINLSNNRHTGNDMEYDYPTVDGSNLPASNGNAPGIYQSLINDPNRESVYEPLDRNDSGLDLKQAQHPPIKPPRATTDPTYDVLEKPEDNDDYLQPGEHIDPGKTPSNMEPVYNVLEVPDQDADNEPDYNTLEDPDYNVLEGPDDAYDNTPEDGGKGHPSSRDNPGYGSTLELRPKTGTKNEPVYQAPEGPLSDPTYQSLGISAHDDSVYQPLDRHSRIMSDNQPVYQVLDQSDA